jgi:hypothetical protein
LSAPNAATDTNITAKQKVRTNLLMFFLLARQAGTLLISQLTDSSMPPRKIRSTEKIRGGTFTAAGRFGSNRRKQTAR